MLQLPVEDIQAPPLVVPVNPAPLAVAAPQIIEAAQAPAEVPLVATPAVDASPVAAPPQQKSTRIGKVPLLARAAIAVGLCAVLLTAGWYMGQQHATPVPTVAPEPQTVATETHAPAPTSSAPQATAPAATQGLDPIRFVSEAEPLARRFLTAKSVDEMLAVVYQPQAVAQKIRDYYPQGKITPAGLSKFDVDGAIKSQKMIHRVMVQTGDFEKRELAFAATREGLKIDWESWVGWSALSWNELLAKRPEHGTDMRVLLTNADYYNYFFKDDKKWRSYRIESADGEHVIYGYVPRDSDLETRLDRFLKLDTPQCILKLHFVHDSGQTKQVVIDDLVWNSWTQIDEETESKAR